MTDVAWLRAELQRLAAKTENTVASPNGFLGDRAKEKRNADNARSGAMSMHFAHKLAKDGLYFLDQDQPDVAEAAFEEAKIHYAAAYERHARKEDHEALRRGVGAPGRNAKAERDIRLAVAVAGYTGTDTAAIHSALEADPALAAEFNELGKPARQRSLREGRALLAAGRKP